MHPVMQEAIDSYNRSLKIVQKPHPVGKLHNDPYYHKVALNMDDARELLAMCDEAERKANELIGITREIRRKYKGMVGA